MTTPSTPAPQLRRVLTLRDLVLFNIVAVLGLRWLATAAKAGPSALVLWLLAAALFFVPQGLAVLELSSRYPREGGIYTWTRETLGEGHGFLCGWCYWINNVLYYPNLLISTAVIATYVVGRGGTALADNRLYIIIATLGALWFAAGVNIAGASGGKWLQNLGGIGTYIPALMLIVLGGISVATHAPANTITLAGFRPDFSNLAALNLWASIAFAFSGMELSATMGDEVRDAARNLPRAIYIAAPLVAAAYILGSASVLWLVPVGELNITSGFIQAIVKGTEQIGGGAGLAWCGVLAAAAYTVGNMGGLGAWLVGPARVAFVIGLDRYFPPAFGRIHPRFGTPYVAILVQAVLATVFLLLSLVGRGTSVERAYLILLDTQLLIYFIPYLYLFLSFLIQVSRSAPAALRAVPGGRPVIKVLGACGFLVTALAMVLAGVPPEGGRQGALFLLKVAGGAAGFLAAGGLIYARGRRRAS